MCVLTAENKTWCHQINGESLTKNTNYVFFIVLPTVPILIHIIDLVRLPLSVIFSEDLNNKGSLLQQQKY